MDVDDAIAVVHVGRGTQFDPAVVDAVLGRLDAVRAVYESSPDRLRQRDAPARAAAPAEAFPGEPHTAAVRLSAAAAARPRG